MSRHHLETCLGEFARGTRPLADLEQCLRGNVRLSFWDTNERRATPLTNLPRVEFTRRDVDAQLQRYLASDLSAQDLSDWAAAMRLLGCFVLDEDDQASSQIWDLIDEIMSPDAWGPITVDSVINLRSRLDEVR